MFHGTALLIRTTYMHVPRISTSDLHDMHVDLHDMHGCAAERHF
jgi:hypothetical protein